MKIRTNIKAGGIQGNHNEKQVSDKKRSAGFKVKTNIKAGGIGTSPTKMSENHNEKLIRDNK